MALRIFIMICVVAILTSCASLLHKRISVTGKALNSKDAAVIQTEDKGYLLHNVARWEDSLYEKEVTVTGYLVVKNHKKKSTAERQVQERVGTVFIIKKARWSIVK